MNGGSIGICVMDTSIATSNVGDEIIMDAVNNRLLEVFPECFFCRLPTKEYVLRSGLGCIRRSKYTFVGGSNILSSKMNSYKQWKIWLWQALFVRQKFVLMGVGWRDYQKKPNLYTKLLLKLLLSRTALHSVRDSYTERFLNDLGFKNVINTSCPTMWGLDSEHCKKIPKDKSDNVVFTLTDYSKDFNSDSRLVSLLCKCYKNVNYWAQGKRDLEYLKSLNVNELERINIIPPNLRSYDEFLSRTDCDYIGTRLHGGIRAIQNKKRTIIIGIDSRALEKKKDFGLKVVERTNLEKLEGELRNPFETVVGLPSKNIEKWKNQFL